MKIYYVFVFSLLISVLIKEKMTENQEKITFNVFASIMLLLSMFRGNGNGDYFKYKELYTLYTTPESLFFKTHVEFGFRILSIILNSLKLPSQSIVAAMSFITLGLLFKVINNYSSNRLLSLLVLIPFWLSFDMQTSRNAVAISIATYTIINYKDFNLKFVSGIFIAVLFHKTAIIMIFYPIYRMIYNNTDSNKKRLLILASVFLGYIVFSGNTLTYITRFIGENQITKKIDWYLASPYLYPMKIYDPRIIILLLEIYIINNSNLAKKNPYKNELYWNIVFIMLFSSYTLFSVRLSAYFNIFQILLIPNLFNSLSVQEKIRLDTLSLKTKNLKLLILIIYIVIILLTIKNYYPYKFCFEIM